MKKLIILMLLLLLVIGCNKKAITAPEAPKEPSTDSIVQNIKETAKQIVQSEAANATKQAAEQASQTVFVPIEQKLPEGAITPTYKSPCLVQGYRGLNIYCSAKNFWHNQSTLLSWYVPYSFILFGLLAAIIIIWWIRRQK